ncbi:MAG: DUF1015 domain-containing protein [Bacillota bacterium]
MAIPCEEYRALAELGVVPAEILLPVPGIDLFKWAVIACDQYTADEDYWRKVAALVGEAPSTLHLVLPEVYLGAPDEEERIARIHQTMREYLTRGILRAVGTGFLYLERRTAFGRFRRGLLAAVDLERYDYRSGSRPPIRATEATVLDRLPPRVRIRRGAVLEVPHAMLLLDDPARRTVEPLAAFAEGKEPLYETKLMMGGGEVRGFMLDGPAAVIAFRAGLEALASSAHGEDSFLLAVGDGNHSLAAAKVVWEEIKAAGAPADHPARYTLVEIVNLYDEGLVLAPIHRVVAGRGPEELLQGLEAYFSSRGSRVEVLPARDRGEAEAVRRRLAEERPGAHLLEFIHAEGGGVIAVMPPPHRLVVGTLQMFLDELEARGRARVDYIHGEEALAALARRPGWVGFFLPAMAKEDLFPTVRKHGVLPKKSFSLGEAEEKRFYLECRRIAEA